MNILYELIEIGACFIDSLIVFKIYGKILHKYERQNIKIKELWIVIVGMLLTWLCNQDALFSLLTMFIFAIYASVAGLFLYKTNIVSLLSIVSFFLLCMSCVEFFFLSVISSVWKGNETLLELISVTGISRTVYIIFIKCLWIFLYLIFGKFLYMFTEKVRNGYAVLIISIIGFIGVTFLISETCIMFDHELTGIWFVIVLVIVFLLFSAYYVIARREAMIKLDYERKQNSLLEKNYKTISDIYNINAKLYHDMNNHLSVLYQLVKDGDNEKAQNYIKEIGKPITAMSNIVWTGDNVIDAVLNCKMQSMKEKGIEADYNVEFPQGTNIMQHDMCTILANLLDNAIEALEEERAKGKIFLTIRRINYFLLVRTVNSCRNNQTKFDLYPETTKENKSLHGWGLSNVRDVVEKYNGTMSCVNERDTFTVTIMLFFEK